MSPRVVVGLTGALIVAILSAGCAGGAASSAPTVAPIQPTSYVVKELVTTTTTITPTTTTTVPGQIVEPYQHTIVANDNPSYLADLYNISLAQLNEANRANPDYSAFPIGGTVIIPAGAIMPNAALVLSSQNASGGSSTGCSMLEHVIVLGDNPTVVAEQYSISVEDLARANVTNATYLSFLLGGTIAIPVGEC
jgi:LysM repeat protein